MKVESRKQGFTIIEVVLVLAIAGLIFLMVFIALPALQRGQRDTQRRDDMARFLSQLNQYQANNNGKTPVDKTSNKPTPAAYTKFVAEYLALGELGTDGKTINNPKDKFEDPSTGEIYTISGVTPCGSGTDCTNKSSSDGEMGHIYVYTNATCEGEDPKYVQGDRKIAITLKLEGAGVYCGHN